jgi:uroporphyrinogen decarboxylase
MKAVFNGTIPDRVPFVPTIYEHAGALIGLSPSKLSQSSKLIVDAQLAAYEKYRHDLITVGVDIYNVEAEAIGCKVELFQSNDIPGISHGIIENKTQFSKLKIPNPSRDGRMNVMIEASSRIKSQLKDEVLVGGTIVGPFTLAAILRGIEPFLLDSFSDPEFFTDLLNFSVKVGERYGEALISRGLGVAINESFCSKPFLSDEMYSKFVFPVHKKIIKSFRRRGLKNIGLIIGGDTDSFSSKLVQTGTSILIADFNTDQKNYKKIASQSGVVLRGNVDPTLLELGTTQELIESTNKVLKIGKPGGRFLLGTGVVPYGAKPENILTIKNLVMSRGKYH